jgi:hypothetical protein
MLKTEHLISWEYSSLPDEMLDQAKESVKAQFEWLESGETDYEIALPIHELKALAEGNGYYTALEREHRLEQLSFLAKQVDVMFPRLRLFLFDAHHLYSAPVTIFGNSLAILYVGHCYLTLRDKSKVSTLMNHFDWLLRGSVIDARDVSQVIKSLTVL